MQLIWEGLIVDALFRGGSKHGNHGRTVKTMLTGMVRLVRKHYSQSVPIIIRMDSGFYDEEILQTLDGLDVGFLLKCIQTWDTFNRLRVVLFHRSRVVPFNRPYHIPLPRMIE